MLDHSKTQKDGRNRPFLLFNGQCEALGRALSPYGEAVSLPPFGELPEGLRAHPDLLTFCGSGTLFTFRSYALENDALFRPLPCRTELLDLPAGAYPDDVWFDHLTVGEYLVGRADRIPREISRLYRTVPVKQGYARCAALCAGERALITADRGIARAAETLGADVLTVEEGHILLPGYSCGFIGGASAVVYDKVLFFGDLFSHPQGEEISRFLAQHGFTAVSLMKGPLYDLGGLAVLYPRDREK